MVETTDMGLEAQSNLTDRIKMGYNGIEHYNQMRVSIQALSVMVRTIFLCQYVNFIPVHQF
jgi:hypothetical protein